MTLDYVEPRDILDWARHHEKMASWGPQPGFHPPGYHDLATFFKDAADEIERLRAAKDEGRREMREEAARVAEKLGRQHAAGADRTTVARNIATAIRTIGEKP